MKKLLTLVLLFTGPAVWAQDIPTDTPVPSATAVIQGNSWGAAVPATGNTGVMNSTPEAVNTPAGAVTSSSTPSETPQTTPTAADTSVVGTDTSTATPGGTPSALPKPPAMTMAATPVTANPVGEHFVFQLDGGPVIPVSGAASTIYGTGFGFDARIGYAFDDVFSVGLETGFYDLSATPAALSPSPGGFNFPAGTTENTSHVPVLFDMQIYFGDSGAPIQPYLVLAGGLGFDADNIQGAPYKPGATYSWVNFELDPAIGVAFMLNRTTGVFVQAKLAMDFDDYNTTDT
ncbi:MAG TPA: hypothetical protein VN963_11335, partial [bacterium]|nr:hypothetical protein [bacterium]